MTDADGDELWYVLQALNQLYCDNRLWFGTKNTFERMSVERRYWWWQAAKKQAEAGAEGMRTLLARVIELRMT